MPQPLYARVKSRGFPSVDYAGQTGEGRLMSTGGGVLGWQPHKPLQGGDTVLGDHGPTGMGTRGYDLAAGVSSRVQGSAAQMGDVGTEWIADAPLWGLPASTRPDDLPRTETAHAEPDRTGRTPHAGHLLYGQFDGGLAVPTHAAPLPTLPMSSPYNHQQESEYFAEENDVHGVNFGGHRQRNDFGFTGQFPGWSHDVENQPGESGLQHLSGPIRAMGGLDPVQGYGGGGRGPGGVNSVHQYGYWRDELRQATDIRPVIVSAAEIPFVTELPQMFTATDPTTIGQPVTYGYNAPMVNMIPQAPYEPPPVATGRPLPAGEPAYAGSFWS